MFTFAILTGIFSYAIFTLGIFGFLYKNNLIILILIFLVVLALIYGRHIEVIKKNNFTKLLNILFIFFNKNKLCSLFLILISIQLCVNLIGSLGPELAFDALWYHLTLPKIYLLNHRLFFIPGGLFYYSAMPKLAEMLYVPLLALGSQIYPKLLHFFFGLLSVLVVYKISRLYLSRKISIITCAIFISSLSFDWLQITAYVDLFRTFFEGLSFFYLLKFVQNKNKNDLFKTGILIGLAITTKLISLFDLSFINLFLIVFFLKEKYYLEKSFFYKIKDLTIFNFISIIIPFPWFIFSYLNTGSFIYPFLSKIYPSSYSLNILNPIFFFKTTWNIFANSSDPLSPIFLLFIPIILFSFLKFKKHKFYLFLLSILIYLAWYFTPLTGGGRFILPFTLIFSVICGVIIDLYQTSFFNNIFLFAVLLSLITSILFRFGANIKYIPEIFRKETKQQFLSKNLNFNFGDFYDTDGYFKRNIKSKDTVLLINFHNLFYVNFPFIDYSYLKKGDNLDYIAVQNGKLPRKYNNWRLIYQNNLTHVKLYKE